jgi:hypothetical protein
VATKKKLDELVEQVDDIVVDEVIEEVVESVAPDPGVDGKVHVVIAKQGDSYASLAVEYANGRKAHALAKELYLLNRGVAVRPGSRILVK